MKNTILSLLVLVGLFGLTATGAQAHPIHGHSHGGHAHFAHYHQHYYNGIWYDCDDDDCVVVPGGFSLHINL
jgi:hypothetical protein